MEATEQKKNGKTETGEEMGIERGEDEGGVEGRSRGRSEVLRREQTRRGIVAHREMEGLGIKEEDGVGRGG